LFTIQIKHLFESNKKNSPLCLLFVFLNNILFLNFQIFHDSATQTYLHIISSLVFNWCNANCWSFLGKGVLCWTYINPLNAHRYHTLIIILPWKNRGFTVSSLVSHITHNLLPTFTPFLWYKLSFVTTLLNINFHAKCCTYKSVFKFHSILYVCLFPYGSLYNWTYTYSTVKIRDSLPSSPICPLFVYT